LFHAAGTSRILAGVMAESRDRVGREFPLTVFVSAEATHLREPFPALPLALRPFLDAGARLLQEAQGLDLDDLPGRLALLPVPGARDMERGTAEARELAVQVPGAVLLERLFGEGGPGQPFYAVHCLRTACEPVRAQEPAQARAVLDCPAREDVDRWLWLEMARRLLRWSGPPSFFWREGDGAKLLLSLGPPPPSLFGTLCSEVRDDAKVWPLVTRIPVAIESAKKALGASVVGSLENPNLSVGELVVAVTS
jgi:type VI secretion system protein ImpM